MVALAAICISTAASAATPVSHVSETTKMDTTKMKMKKKGMKMKKKMKNDTTMKM